MVDSILLGGLIMHIMPQPEPVERVSFQKNAIIKTNNINLLIGNNSIGKFIYGAGYDFKLKNNLNFKIGGYIQDETEFNKLGVEVATADFMPIIGLEYKLYLTRNISLTNIITPLITLSGLEYHF